MDEKTGAEQRQRMTRWLEESRQMLNFLPELLDANGQLTLRAVAAEQECERLRKEIEEFEKLRKDVEELKRDNQLLRGERDEIAQSFAKLMETVQPMNQIAQKLGLKKSPFEREPRQGGAPPPTAAPQSEGGKTAG